MQAMTEDNQSRSSSADPMPGPDGASAAGCAANAEKQRGATWLHRGRSDGDLGMSPERRFMEDGGSGVSLRLQGPESRTAASTTTDDCLPK